MSHKKNIKQNNQWQYAYRYSQIHARWKHTEKEHFGRFQDLIKILISLRKVAPLQDAGGRFQILVP